MWFLILCDKGKDLARLAKKKVFPDAIKIDLMKADVLTCLEPSNWRILFTLDEDLAIYTELLASKVHLIMPKSLEYR